MFFDLSIAGIITRLIVLFVSVGVHEFGHAYAAYLMGDPTAKEQGRMTLNPIPNIWWPGFLIGVLGGFAILGSAPVNPYRMRNPRWGSIVATAAGPFASLLLGLLFGLLFLIDPIDNFLNNTGQGGAILPTPYGLALFGLVLNILLFFFNLIPLFPLDGWHILYGFLPPRAAIWWERNKVNSMYLLFGLIVLQFITDELARLSPVLAYLDILRWVVGEPTRMIVQWFLSN